MGQVKGGWGVLLTCGLNEEKVWVALLTSESSQRGGLGSTADVWIK